MPSSRESAAQRAVDRAQAAIEGYLRTLPGSRAETPEQRARLDQLQGAWIVAVARLREAQAREGEDEPAAVAA